MTWSLTGSFLWNLFIAWTDSLEPNPKCKFSPSMSKLALFMLPVPDFAAGQVAWAHLGRAGGEQRRAGCGLSSQLLPAAVELFAGAPDETELPFPAA